MKHFSTFWKILLAITFYASNVDAQSFEKLTDLASLKAGDELLLVYEGAKGDTLALGPPKPVVRGLPGLPSGRDPRTVSSSSVPSFQIHTAA